MNTGWREKGKSNLISNVPVVWQSLEGDLKSQVRNLMVGASRYGPVAWRRTTTVGEDWRRDLEINSQATVLEFG